MKRIDKFIIKHIEKMRHVSIMAIKGGTVSKLLGMSSTLTLTLIFLFCTTGCDRGSDSRRDDQAKPGNGGREEPIKPPTNPDSIQRPGVGGGEYDFSKELTDATWRFIGDGTELRYTSSGILFKTAETDNSKTVEIIDLDGSDRIIISIGEIGTDSTVNHPSIKVNNREVKLSQMKMMKATPQSTWYHLISTEGTNCVLVTPPCD